MTSYEKKRSVVYTEVQNTEATIIAAKPNNPVQFIIDYTTHLFGEIFLGPMEDAVFKELENAKLDPHTV